MNEITIKNVDENGDEIVDVDWSKWSRIRVEEVTDDKGNVIEILSHCQKFSEEDLCAQLLQQLKATEAAVVQVALCELLEQQAAYENDVNAALWELYDLIAGGGTNG